MAELGLPSRTILSILSQEHMPRDRDASNPVAFDPVPPTGSVAVPGYISALLSRNHRIWVRPTIMRSCSIIPDVIVPLFSFDHVLGLSLLSGSRSSLRPLLKDCHDISHSRCKPYSEKYDVVGFSQTSIFSPHLVKA